MAAQGDSHGDYKPGSMDISEHLKAWAGFTVFVKWSIVGVILIMGFLALFRTHG
ncbi:MAG TPA: aa3-type cytochrome c oxidase subunit IV [Rhizomicrobium sp.]|nr:aa3-type cytochrome c oxidase subunit IV [Rhizomicrobium sp.]